MEINDTITLADVPVPSGITLLDELDETVVATLSPPRVDTEDDEIESETAVVGEAAPSGESAGDSD
jgi:large subunit ribosomal protein L25